MIGCQSPKVNIYNTPRKTSSVDDAATKSAKAKNSDAAAKAGPATQRVEHAKSDADRLAALEVALRADVQKLAGDIGERNVEQYEKLVAAAAYIKRSFSAAGYKVATQDFKVEDRTCQNIEVEIRGEKLPDEIVVVGAHYDSARGCPAANDNASGTAGLLAIARAFAGKKTNRTLRFVAFTNEEPPFFQTPEMGSLVYARRCKQRKENVVAMLSLETIGYYTDAKDSQKYPLLLKAFYPSTGNFIGFVGNVSSMSLVTQTVNSFRSHSKFPSESASLHGDIKGVGWSDHWSFWQEGYKALMVTDTAPFRYPHYHEPEDTPDKIVYDRMAQVVSGLKKVVEDLDQSESVGKSKKSLGKLKKKFSKQK